MRTVNFIVRTSIPISAIALSSSALSQITPLEFGIGYGQSARFEKTSGGHGTLQGLELSVSQRMLKVPLLGEAQIGVSGLFGGMLASGGDADGTVFRFFARGKSTGAATQGFYGIGGVYVAFANGRGGSFGAVNGIGLDFGVGMPINIGTGIPGAPSTAIEFITHQGSNAQTRGWSLGLKFRM